MYEDTESFRPMFIFNTHPYPDKSYTHKICKNVILNTNIVSFFVELHFYYPYTNIQKFWTTFIMPYEFFYVCARSNILSNWPQVGQVNDEERPHYNIILIQYMHICIVLSFQEEIKVFWNKNNDDQLKLFAREYMISWALMRFPTVEKNTYLIYKHAPYYVIWYIKNIPTITHTIVILRIFEFT